MLIMYMVSYKDKDVMDSEDNIVGSITFGDKLYVTELLGETAKIKFKGVERFVAAAYLTE